LLTLETVALLRTYVLFFIELSPAASTSPD
jgi:hypothetical protein